MKIIFKLIVTLLLLVPQTSAAQCVQGDCTNGQGTVVLQDGRRYVGEFNDGIRTGRGLMTFPDGTKYLGDWLNDKPHGQGTLSAMGKFEYAGEFANGVREGQGTLETVDGKKYTGQWLNDVPHGKGKITYPDGGVFIGQFENGRRNGEGEVVYTDGTKYIGHWKDDLPNGHGTKILVDGEQYTGEFRNGLMHGRGTVVLPDGTKYNGQWQGDVLVKKEEAASETKFSTVDETEGHVLAVVDEKPVQLEQEVPQRETGVEDESSQESPLHIANVEAGYASVMQNGVFVRSGPSTEYRIIRSVSRGFPVQVIGQQDNWSYIKDSVGQEGWIYTPLLGKNNSAIVNAAKVNLRSGPGLNFMVVNQLEFGSVLQVNNVQGDWYKVQTIGGVKGWLNRELIWPAGLVATGQEITKSENLNGSEDDVKNQAFESNIQEQQVQEIPVEAEQEEPREFNDTIARVDEVRVVSEQPEEMLARKEVEMKAEAMEAETAKTVIAKVSENVQSSETERIDLKSAAEYVGVTQNGRGANIRTEPSLASEVLRSVAPGYPMVVREHRGDWVLVEDFRERKGWVFASLLTDLETVVIKVGKGNLRSGPTLINEIVAKLDYGAIMFVEQTKGDWLQVKNSEGVTGWLHQDIVWP